MFELPERMIITNQMEQYITEKRIRHGQLDNTPHKFVWYNRKHDEFTALIPAKKSEGHMPDVVQFMK